MKRGLWLTAGIVGFLVSLGCAFIAGWSQGIWGFNSLWFVTALISGLGFLGISYWCFWTAKRA